MKTLSKLALGLLCAAATLLPLQAMADDRDHDRWDKRERHEWRHDRHEWRHDRHDRGRHLGHWKHHRYEREVFYVREPVPVYGGPVIYGPSRPAVIIHVPPVVIPF